MGLFGFGSKKNNNTQPQVATPSNQKINLAKEESIARINLKKEEVRQICLRKPELNGLTSRVALVLDYSGSMNRLYKNGTVQSIIEKMLPIAMNFDDNGEMEVWIFDNGFNRLANVNLGNYFDYVNNNIIGKYKMGGTSYAPVMNDIFNRYIKEEPANIPNYIIFITDGDNSDHGRTNDAIKKLSEYPIFFQFVGIGHEQFAYLQKLDDMKNRYVDNADFFKVSNAEDITYEQLLNEYPQWIANPNVQNMFR